MARGFESKDVEFQQSEAERRESTGWTALSDDERAAMERKETVQLSLTRMRTELERAHLFAHRRTIERAIEALEQELRAFTS